jgi:hypothetical protein
MYIGASVFLHLFLLDFPYPLHSSLPSHTLTSLPACLPAICLCDFLPACLPALPPAFQPVNPSTCLLACTNSCRMINTGNYFKICQSSCHSFRTTVLLTTSLYASNDCCLPATQQSANTICTVPVWRFTCLSTHLYGHMSLYRYMQICTRYTHIYVHQYIKTHISELYIAAHTSVWLPG